MKKKIVSILLVAAMAATMAIGCGNGGAAPASSSAAASTAASSSAAKTIKVGIIDMDPNESGYRTANVADLQATFTKENGYDAQFFFSMENDKQLEQAEKMITDEVDYLLLAASKEVGWEDVLTKAQKQGVKVILFDRSAGVKEDLYEAAVLSDMAKEGETAVNWLKEQKLPEYNIIHIQGAPESAAQLGRGGALEEQCKADANWNIVATQTTAWSEKEGEDITEGVIAKGDKFNVIYAHNDGLAKGAVKALDAHNISHGVGKDVIVMGFDVNKFALRELQAGNWNYDGQCNPFQASYMVDIINKLEAGEKIAEKTIYVTEVGLDATKITEEDIAKYGIGEDPGVLKK